MTSVTKLRSSREGAICTRCEAKVTAPEWSENVSAQETVHLWRCWCCGNQFETSDHCHVTSRPTSELIEEFLPNLLVG